MNIHIMPNQKFTQMFCEFIINYYPENSNIVYVYRDDDFELIKSDYVKAIESFDEIDLYSLGSNEKLFIHGFYDFGLIKYLYKNRRNYSSKQLVMIMWGADLYNNKLILQRPGLHLGIRYIEFLKKKVMKKSRTFMTFAAPDFDLAKEWYGVEGKQFDCLYPSNADIKQLDELKSKNKASDTVRILLGNSATFTNMHFEALDWLARYKEENIEIICPLSYGDKQYGDEVVKYGQNIFGDKFIPLLDYMSPGDYSEMLNSIDVVVFNHNRQQGTGNIEILAYLGKKLYIRSDITSWGHYVLRDKCSFYDARKIPEMSFDEFRAFSADEINNNENYFRKIWDINYVKTLWDDVMAF